MHALGFSAHGLIAWIVIGVVAGWLAGMLVKGGGFGLIGVIGAIVGGWLAGRFGIHIGSGMISSIITAVIGAVLLLFIIRLVRRAA
jgi:uncharacterized membrane protein YeaQ/YmgE (transglycosylase-associated protein family)